MQFGKVMVAAAVLSVMSLCGCGGSGDEDSGSITRQDSHPFTFPDGVTGDVPAGTDSTSPADPGVWDDGPAIPDLPHDIPVTVPDPGTVIPDVPVTDPGPMDPGSALDLTQADDPFTFPETTDDCEPLGFANEWEGTFEGNLDSNIPDMMGYTFKGPVNGAMSFEIACVNGDYRILGILEGGQTNCALENGCPFFGYLSGTFEVATSEIVGQIKQASIDYTVLKVLAAGNFSGKLHDGDTFEGDWDGHKTDVVWANGDDATSLDWVSADGGGLWEATAAE